MTWFRKYISDAAALRTTKYGLAPLAALAFVSFCQRLDSSLFSNLLPEIRRDLDISLSTAAGLLAVTGLLAALLGPAVGYLADRTDRTKLVGLSAIVSGLASTLTGAVPTIHWVYGARSADEASFAQNDRSEYCCR